MALSQSQVHAKSGLVLSNIDCFSCEDASLMLNELLEYLPHVPWEAHFRSDHHNNKWFILNLKLLDDSSQASGIGSYSYTNILSELPLTRVFFDKHFPTTRRIRLMKLEPGGKIFWHYDSMESGDYGVYRLHIPVLTNVDCLFHIGWHSSHWVARSLFYADFSFPHSVTNAGTTDLIHIIIDYEHEFPPPPLYNSYFWDGFPKRLRFLTRHLFQFICDAWCMRRGLRDIKRFARLYILHK